jgi:hypothetical protein
LRIQPQSKLRQVQPAGAIFQSQIRHRGNVGVRPRSSMNLG